MTNVLDALSSIADTLDAYGSKSSRLALMQREARSLDHESTPLASAIRSTLHKKRRYKDIGDVSIIDATCRDLEFSGRVDIAQELTALISGVIDRMGEWEKSWGTTVKRYGLEVDRHVEENPEYMVGAGDYLGQLNDQTEYEALQQFDGVTEQVTDVVSWIRQFVIVQRKLKPEAGSQAAAREQWPVGDGWEFRPGECAYDGIVFKITGQPAAALQLLAKRSGQPIRKSAILEAIDPDGFTSDIKDALAAARTILRKEFGLPSTVDPIPNVERGPDAAWKLDESFLSHSTKILR